VPDLVADLVAAMLGRPDLGRSRLRLVVGSEHRLEEPGAAEDVRRVLREQIEEPLVAGNEPETQQGVLRGPRAFAGLVAPRRGSG
jgi:hypothetical protein